MKLTFRLKIFLYFVVTILVTSIPIAIITYNHMYKSLKEDLFSNTHAEMVQIDNNFSNMFNQIKENNRFLATSKDVEKADQSISALFNMSNNNSSKKYSQAIPGLESTIYKYLQNYGTTHEETAYAYIGTRWGGYIQWPDGLTINNFDPRVRPWYSQATANPDKVEISVPYASSDETKAVIISASSTIKNEVGDIVGVMGIDVSLEKLSEMIRKVKIGNGGYVFMYLKDGTIIAHPNTELNFKYISQWIKDGDSSDKNSNLLKGSFDRYNKFLDIDNGNFETVIDGNTVVVNVYTSPNTGWKMATVIQESEISEKANKIGYLITMITALILLFIIMLTYIVTKKLTKPIKELTPLMNSAGNGDLTVKADIKTNDEFGQLGKSFNLMIDKLCTNYDELAAMHEELIATEEELRAQYDELLFNEEALRESEERYKLALECANDSIWEWNLVTREFFASDKFYDITGYKLNKNVNIIEFIVKIVYPDDKETAKRDFYNHINNITKIYQSEFRIKNNNGVYMWISTRGKILRNSEGKATIFSGSITDISDRKNSEDKIRFMAYYDSLTKLPNRTLFMDKLNEELELAKKQKSSGAVFFIDLDNFKNINDTLGHDYGDKLLTYLARKFESIMSKKDTICRFGGDEFILLHPCANESDVEVYSKKLLSLFDMAFKIDNKQMYITASIGVTLYPKDGIDINTILKNADSAMYKAKALGKNRFALFDPDIYLRLERKINIERVLRAAIENNEFFIHYQPQYSALKNEIFGFEALIRLNNKELGFISPLEFITVAEECGYITEISKWMIKEVCKQGVKWINSGYKFESISINISSVDLQQPDFLENIKDILKNTEINPNIVELEITETVLMQSLDLNIEILKKLMNMGIRIALDDFGTGYSSLSYLRKIPINTLKIDKSFIDNITCDKKEESIINNIIQMAHSMELKVVAEGVETKDQLEILKERNCDYIQGYYFSRPLPADEAEKLLL